MNEQPFDPLKITRPHPRLMKYYLIIALLTGPLFPIVILPLYFKYETLKYRFDNDGISMSWGILFRREVYLTYRRIQDIHLTRGIIQRWLGLATVSVQTASGSATPEMSIDGLLEAEELRDYLYTKMRGVHHEDPSRPSASGPQALSEGSYQSDSDEALRLLVEIRDGIRNWSAGRGAR